MKIIDIAIAIIIDDNQQVLIALRPAEVHLGDLWEFPGGKVETEELPEDAVVREAMEECGIKVKVCEKWEVIEYSYPDKSVRLHPFLCKVVDGMPQSIGNLIVKWIPYKDLYQYEFPAANSSLLDRLAGPVL